MKVRRPRVTIFVVLAILFVLLAVYYWVTPAGSLPHFLPGYEVGSTHTHLKHGLASLIVGVGFMILAWFSSGKKQTSTKTETEEKD